MPNLRIIHANYADLATSLAASGSVVGTLVAANMQTDFKGVPHRSTGTSVTYTLTWTGGVSIGGVALPATNLSASATMRVRLYSDTACTALLQDTGANIACPGLSAVPWTWTGVYNCNAFAYGALSKAVAWFAANQTGVKGMKIDLSDATNAAGYIDCSRIVTGPWWSPAINADTASISPAIVDDSTNARTDGGDLSTDRATMHEELPLRLAMLTEAERSHLAQLMRSNGVWKPVFISLMPGAGTAAEQDLMLYGKRKNSPFDLPGFARYAHSMTLESW